MFDKLKEQYETDLAKLIQAEQSLKQQLEQVVSKIFSFRGALAALEDAKKVHQESLTQSQENK